MQAGPDERRLYLVPATTTLKMARQAIRSEDYAPFYWRLFFFNVAGNIAWFLPLGFLLPWEAQSLRPFRNLVAFAFFFSLAAETLQYAFAVGIFDIDDVILNTSGAALGWGIFRIIFRNKYSVLTKK
jgi:glycopeptide antibiotics resistance protein